MKDDLQTELDELRAHAKTALKVSRRDTNVDWGDGGGTLDTPVFRFTVLCDQDPDDPARYRVRRQLELRDGWQAQRDAIEAVFAATDLPRLVVEIEPMPAAFDSIAEKLDDLATRTGATFEERSGAKSITYSDGRASVAIDLQKGRVELSFTGADGLEVLERAHGYSLGWRAASPMLPPPASGPERTRGKSKLVSVNARKALPSRSRQRARR